MTVNELDRWLSDYLETGKFPMDPSQNGIQVGNSDPVGKPVSRIAFGVDACLETILRAREAGAGLLVVHHGLLWGRVERVCGIYYRRVKALLDADMALFACHLPLDAHPVCGNNYGMASRLSLTDTAPFGQWREASIGVIGELPRALPAQNVLEALFPGRGRDCRLWPFGTRSEVRRVAIVSGGAGDMVGQAAEAGADLYVTGEVGHEEYHRMAELGLTVAACGHYLTETVGVALLAERVRASLNLETMFVDVPTGM
ncbi:MAG: Nif3-like dinuclear metal center hexameric protein [Spirochaetaceae bacterium]|jgi:dinuclear metal center YbgI/SA1388 family protein|nr:Nif3-like dinuclear metal center hexameric protein [Spirochaetaceae bacterium]